MTQQVPENKIADLSHGAIQDLDRVIGTAIGVAREQLESVGAFLPFAIALEGESSSEDDDAAPAGELRLLAVQPGDDTEDPDADIDAEAMMADLVTLIKQQEHLYVAVALVSDVTLVEEDRDAIHVNAEHREGGAAGAVSAYTAPAESEATAGDWIFDQPVAEIGVRLVWS